MLTMMTCLPNSRNAVGNDLALVGKEVVESVMCYS